MTVERIKSWPYPSEFKSVEDAHEYARRLYFALQQEGTERVQEMGTLGLTGLTAGSVLFAGTGSIIAQDNDKFYWDDTNKRFSVGETTPTHRLHIDSTGLDDVAGSLLVTGGTQLFIQVDSTSRARFIADAHDADASIELQEDDTIKWTVGFDYTDSLKFKISEGVPGTNTRMEIIPGGSMNVYDTASGHIQITANASGTARLMADSYTGDAYVELQEQNVLKWTAGFDYTDSNAYLISEGAPGTNTRFKIASGGNLTAGGTLSIGEITVIDGSGINLQEDITFTGATTENKINIPDNLLDAFSVWESSNKYMTFDTVNDEEDILFYKSVDILHTSTHADDHALEIDTDAAGYGDVKAIDLDYITGQIDTGQDEGIILVNIDETLADGGDVFGLEVLATDGSAGIYGMKVGAVIGPIHQDSGTFANPTKGTDNTIGSSVTNTSIGFTQSPDTITDSNNGFGNFVVGELVVVTGATTGANNTTYTITVATASALTVTPQPNTVENDGATITVEGNVPAMLDDNLGTTTAIFEANSEYILIGAAAAFEEIEFILTTVASGAGIKPTFWYSKTGSHQFTQFTPVDGTDGLRHTGVVAWDAGDLTSHAVNTDTGTYDIKVIRTRSNLTTSPVLGYAKTAATTEYVWDKNGDVNIRNLTTSGGFTFSGANPDIIGGDTDGILSITADTATNQGGNIKLYGNTHASLAQDIEFYADATKVLEWDESEANWDFNSTNIKGVGTFASGDITVDAKLVLSAGSITDGDGTIDFGDENLVTTGRMKIGATAAFAQLDVETTGAGDHGIYAVAKTNSSGVYGMVFYRKTAGDAYVSAASFCSEVYCALLRYGASRDTAFTVTVAPNVGIGTATFGTNATMTLAQITGTAPTTSPADSFQMYSADIVVGNAAPHFRTENGTVVQLGVYPICHDDEVICHNNDVIYN